MQCFDTKAAKMGIERGSSLGIVVDFFYINNHTVYLR